MEQAIRNGLQAVGALALLLCVACNGGSSNGGGSAQNDNDNDDDPTPELIQVSTQVGDDGGIDPTEQEVESGETASFTVQPDLGFEVATISGCDGALSDNDYVTGPITEACTIEITFARILATPEWLHSEGEDEGIALSWSSIDEADFYRLYYSTSSNILPGHGAVSEADSTDATFTLSGLDNGTTYYLALEARSNNDFGSDLSAEIRAVPFPTAHPAFNDTGFDQCGTGTSAAFSDCPLADYPSQDGDHGRDADARDDSLDKFGTGSAGFDFTKLDAEGDVLLDQTSTDFSCVRDNTTGLTWEVKTNDGGLHHFNHTYSWYSDDATSNGGEPGEQDGGTCFVSACDTQAFTAAVNENQLCGYSNWRLPTVIELHSIVDYGQTTTPRVDQSFFPNTISDEYWTSQTYASNVNNVWVLNFEQGRWLESGHVQKINDRRVRLVRSPVSYSE